MAREAKAPAKKKVTKAPSAAKAAKSTKAAQKKASAPKVRKTTKAAAKDTYHTLRPAKSQESFLSARFTTQSIYWVIIGIVILAFGGWVTYLQLKINDIYDKIDQNQAYYDQLQEIDARSNQNKKAIENANSTAQPQ